MNVGDESSVGDASGRHPKNVLFGAGVIGGTPASAAAAEDVSPDSLAGHDTDREAEPRWTTPNSAANVSISCVRR